MLQKYQLPSAEKYISTKATITEGKEGTCACMYTYMHTYNVHTYVYHTYVQTDMHRYMTAYRRVTQLCMFCMYVLEPNVKPISRLNISREVLQELNLLRRGQKNVKD